MKITEIVSESLVGSALSGALKLGKKALGKGATAADDAAQAGKGKLSQQADKIRAAQAEKNAANAAAQAEREAAAFLTKHYSQEAIKWINFFGLANAGFDYYKGSAALKAKYPDGGPEYDKEYRNLLGLSISQAIAPKIAIWASNKLRITKLLSVFPGFVKMIGMPNAASVIKSVSSASAQAALTVWFGTKPGQEWLTNVMGGVITGTVGNIAIMAGNALVAAAGVLTGDKSADDYNPWSDQGQAAKPAADGAKDDVAGTSQGSSSTGGTDNKPYDPNRINKVLPYDFSTKSLNDKKNY